MLTLFIANSQPPFFRHINVGVVSHFPAITYCQVVFDACVYQDSLFDEYAIPFPAELGKTVPKRRAEYLAVRYAARRLLEDAGCAGHVGTAASRAPVWPTGWCGSLSHTGNHAIAVIAPSHTGLTPGIDIEMLAPGTMRETATIFTDTKEQSLLANCGIPYETALLIAFSVKESLFKALYPEAGCFFGFDAARVCSIEPATQRITLELTQSLTPRRKSGHRIRGYYLLQAERVITLIA
ncbi:4'-phosphopantetheinyl transferase superfamily protein [Kosakonia sp. ML.JS2a]|uniref:4'-phosphopantetheinyl transferase family protein n=1 Tax=Kosakonia sp. ML.JS2a TaxID=2980557 RepID=UPI0021D8AEEB|nr:4'-phosphopantetheinyl transferase superfamily protein [Kosakonia sp. ML.JS2a]UXY11697.1 4'-phosphopantetheinyl transferase superfamily protein [Kosakonia sp. ML.JS2a]